jgi:putative SOS response-associated peptidase YedK
MCGRINIIDDNKIRGFLDSLGLQETFVTRYNIAPTENIPVITGDGHGLTIRNMRWWLTPAWAPAMSTKFSMFNARSETVETSKAFRGAFQSRRGIVPISSFIEWKSDVNGKQPHLIRTESGCMALAAIWDTWQQNDYYLESCAILTTKAKDTFSEIHNRMPVIISASNINAWLKPTTNTKVLKDFFDAELSPPLSVCTLSKSCNNTKNKDDRAATPTSDIRYL